jgi:SAM-dependent methyltransferase
MANADPRAGSFDKVADLYDRYRPPPPGPVIDALISATGISARSRVVEFGCGTGQVSVPLAATGAELICVDPGAGLTAVAARNLKPFGNARVECASFEAWPAPADKFDVVVVANAFHWLDPELRLSRPPTLLSPGGSLAILRPQHVRGGTPGFAEASQHAYVRSGLAEDLTFRPPLPSEVPASHPELESVPAYEAVTRERFEISRRYTTREFTGMLQTDSMVNTLDLERRSVFLDDIAALIDGSFGGEVERNYLYELILATRG